MVDVDVCDVMDVTVEVENTIVTSLFPFLHYLTRHDKCAIYHSIISYLFIYLNVLSSFKGS